MPDPSKPLVPPPNKGASSTAPAIAPAAAEAKAAELPRWQVRYKSGQGEQVQFADEAAVREWAAGHYGADYEIDSIEEIKP